MVFFVTMANKPQSHRVLRTKEELLNEISELFDKSTANGCTHFDIVVDTDERSGD